MSDKTETGPYHNLPVDFEALEHECAVLVDTFMEGMSEALGLPPGVLSVMHVSGVAVMLTNSVLCAKSTPKPALQWLHDQLLSLHEISHVALEEGGEAARAFAKKQREEDDEAPAQGCDKPHLH